MNGTILRRLTAVLLAISVAAPLPLEARSGGAQFQMGSQQPPKSGEPPKPAEAAKPQEAQRPPQQERQGQRPPQAGGERQGGPEGGPPRDPLATALGGLRFRLVGPAMVGGRISAITVNPQNRAHYFVGVASGGVWKTVNNGTTWTPVFDNEGSYSIGTVVMDPKNPSVVWVGTGENNSQRSVGYGDGVYRSEDGGRTWRNLGLKNSEHIARILIDPRDSNIVYVAAQGPLWGAGGDRGLYKTTDGGKTWTQSLKISDNTGVTDVVMDPRDPNVLYAAAYQRRRHVWTLIDGGPECAIHKSNDGGATWTRLAGGLPNGEMGRVGLAIAPTNPDILYAQVEAANRRGGIYRSTDRGATWERRNEYDTTAMYYSTISVDPKDAERIYTMNVRIMVSDDGGTTLRPLAGRFIHVDYHVLWIDPNNTDYYLTGNDGGLYESFDRAANWHFKGNLPIAQFYDIATDNDTPYNVYGGTQDNNSLGGPSRTRNVHGIANSDWFVTNGGDGFQTRVDPVDPNIVYATSQEGGLVRFDRKSGERVGLKPTPGKGGPPMRWNWDSPVLISPHAHTRIYFASNIVFRSDDRGDTWRAISGDITRQIDRDKLPVMGKVWSPDAVAKHASTALYGNATVLVESPKKEGQLYAGTDDGLIQITEDGGKNWRKLETFPGVPEQTYVSRILPSQHDASVVYASFDNHKNADFAPYLLKSTDNGKTWTAIKGDLPERGNVLAIAEDHVNPALLFVGTEFGAYVTFNGGQKWTRLRGGLPTIPVRDIAIQKRENDLVLGTFGRGIYILDNYSPLQTLKPEALQQQEAMLFPVKEAVQFIPSAPWGGGRKGSQGESLYVADNPPVGATFTFFMKDALRTKRQQRQEAARAAERRGETPPYPTREQLAAEEEEEAPAVVVTVTDAAGNVVRRLNGAITAGIQRVTWDMRYSASVLGGGGGPQQQQQDPGEGPQQAPSGPLVVPGEFKVSVARRLDGEWKQLAGPVGFKVVADGMATLPAPDRAALAAFQLKAGRLQGAFFGALQVANEARTRLTQIKRALQETPGSDEKLRQQTIAIEKRLNDILVAMRGDTALRQRNENTPPSIQERVGVAGGGRSSTSKPTQTQMDNYAIGAEEFGKELAKLRALLEGDLAKLEKAMDALGAPWTPGRLPEWKD
jgi:photosystem II stability/assembly factor-like uncharacterized protein